ncbi:MAG: acyl-CoA thioesterase, partial [Actinomycetota bacterium]
MDSVSVTNFADQTAVEGEDGRYRATIHSQLATPLGPYGAYVAGIALGAAGVHSKFDRPASISCHFLKPAKFGEAEFEVETLRSAKRAESLRVSMTQEGERVVEAIVWAVAEMSALEHQVEMPEVPGPDELRPLEELVKFRNQSDFDMAVEGRPLFDRTPEGEPPWGPDDMEPGPPVTRGWIRLRAQPAFENPFVEAARRLIPIDWMVSG